MITKFEVGQRYEMRSPCNYECVWEYTVTKRTEKSVWLMVHTEVDVRRFRISTYEGIEQVHPLGKYSMNPILSADKKAGPTIISIH